MAPNNQRLTGEQWSFMLMKHEEPFLALSRDQKI